MKTRMAINLKRGLSLTVCLIILLGLLPFGALAADMVRVYCYAPEDWQTCNVHWWGSSRGDAIWPGDVMTKGEDGIWYGDIPSDVSGLLFNKAGDDGKTYDLSLPTAPAPMYVIENREWANYGDDIIIREAMYTVAGSEGLCDVAWYPEHPSGQMEKRENGWYEKFYADVPAGEHLFKVTDGTWSNCWGDIERPEDVNNICLNLSQSGDVLIRFDSVNKNVVVYAENRKTVYTPEYTYDKDLLTWGYSNLEGNTIWEHRFTAETDGMIDVDILSCEPNATVVIFEEGSGIIMETIDKPGKITIPVTANWDYLINVCCGGYDSPVAGRVSMEVSVEKDHPSQTDVGKILQEAYNLGTMEYLPYEPTLIGRIIRIDTPYNSQYQNITVTIEIPGYEQYPIKCFRLVGEGVDTLQPGATITVTGQVLNYYGTVEFDAGCYLEAILSEGNLPPEDPWTIVDEAWNLGENESLPYMPRLTGTVVSIDEPYSEQYRNITLTIVVAGREEKPIVCYRLKGEGVEYIQEGDTISVVGSIRRYVRDDEYTCIDQIEFYDCVLSEQYVVERKLYVMVPNTWTDAYAFTWEPMDLGEWPGTEMQKIDDWYSTTIKYSTKNLVLSDGTDFKKTMNISLPTGSFELWIVVHYDDNYTIYTKEPEIGTYTLRVKAPESWGDTVSAYTWDPEIFGSWPGTAMVRNGDYYEIVLPAGIKNLVINDYDSGNINETGALEIQPNRDVDIIIYESGRVYISYTQCHHTYVTVEVPASCTMGEHTVMICENCGYEKPNSATQETSPALGHDYVSTAIAATCVDEGYTIHGCERCGEYFIGGRIQPLGHNITNYISNGDATCSEDGTKTGYCIRCEEQCTVIDPGTALGHQFTHYLYDLNASCTADGTETAKCDRCSATKTVPVPGTMLEHRYENGLCVNCGRAQSSQGDVNGDGKINMADVAKTFAHVRGKSKITDENILLSADANEDGKINIADVSRIFAHVRGKNLLH